MLTTVVLFLVVIINDAALNPGKTLTLNTCGKYDEYQKWKYNNGLISLSSSSNLCLECSGAGYCSHGQKPIVAGYCDNSDYRENFKFIPVSGKSSVNIQVNGLCLQPLGAEEYASIQILDCNTGYNNDDLQQFIYDSSSLYMKSAMNDSLCVTAMYYPISNCSEAPLSSLPYCDATKDIDTRVQDLVSRMTIYEKIDNLAGSNIGVPRLGVPPNKVLECLHGVFSGCGATYNGNTGCPTSFPNALLLGATFNRSLWNQIGITISDEGRALDNQNIGGLYCFSPNINLFRDPRWGRGQEVPGEDPYLTAQYGIQYIYGIQYGVSPGSTKPKYLKMSNTVKHYADYDLEGCRYGVPCRTAFNAIVSQQDQVEYYFPAWRAAFQVSNAQSIMCSYNAINGIPACGNNNFMNEIARNEWNFTGFVISDSGAITDDAFTEYVKKNANGNDDPLIRTKLSLENGCDADLGDGFYALYMDAAYTNNDINISSIDLAVSRWMKRAFMLGQMDNPSSVPYKSYGIDKVDSAQNRKLALNAAQQGIVLLKNENNNTLPLSRDTSIKYAFIGPHFNATQDLLSSYRGDNTLVNTHSPYQIGKEQGLNIVYSQGCNVQCESQDGFADAVNTAKSADKVVIFLGLYPMQYAQPNQNYSQALEAEDHDRENVTFPGYQFELLQQIYAANPNAILVMINSAQIDLTWPKMNIPGIVYAMYPGEMGGDAIISILYGDVSPAGKLPYTLYNMSLVNNRDITDMSLSGNGGITYRYYQNEPVYPFGFGLSYTSFSYKYYNVSGNGMIETKKLADYYKNGKYFASDEETQYIVQVTNTGKMNSDCVVLGFMTYSNANATSPKIKLFDFERVYVEIGQSVNVTLSISAESISYVNKNGVELIMPGYYNLFMGDYMGNNYVKTRIKLIGEPQVIFDMNKFK